MLLDLLWKRLYELELLEFLSTEANFCRLPDLELSLTSYYGYDKKRLFRGCRKHVSSFKHLFYNLLCRQPLIRTIILKSDMK